MASSVTIHAALVTLRQLWQGVPYCHNVLLASLKRLSASTGEGQNHCVLQDDIACTLPSPLFLPAPSVSRITGALLGLAKTSSFPRFCSCDLKSKFVCVAS